MVKEKYYVNGKKYSPDRSKLLCSYEVFDGLLVAELERLYRTAKGSYFIVSEKKGTKEVAVLDEQQALEFIKAHPVGIDTDEYDQIFGEPEEG